MKSRLEMALWSCGMVRVEVRGSVSFLDEDGSEFRWVGALGRGGGGIDRFILCMSTQLPHFQSMFLLFFTLFFFFIYFFKAYSKYLLFGCV